MFLSTPLHVAAIAPKTTRAVALVIAPSVEKLCPPWLDNQVLSTAKPMALADSHQAGIRRGILAALGLDLDIADAADPSGSSAKHCIWTPAVRIAEQAGRSCPSCEYIGAC